MRVSFDFLLYNINIINFQKKISRVKHSLRFRIKNELAKRDYQRLTEFLEENPDASIVLLPSICLEHLSVDSVMIAIEGFGYKISTKIVFDEPIGFEVHNKLRLNDGMHIKLTENRRNFKLSKIVTESADLGKDLNIILKVMERIVNHTCIKFGEQVEQTFMLDSELLDKQLDTMLQRKEVEKRGEIPQPFGVIHAKGSKDAKERAGNLIPLYKEHDKTYLYDAKRVYYLLPHSFVVNLLRCDEATMVREEEFDKRGEDVLRDLIYRRYLRKHETLGGIICYYGLNEKTRRYLKKHLEHKKPRF